jgi:hypothetical protein
VTRPETKQQGKTVIEADGKAFLIMHPDGSIEGAATKRDAERKARQWYQRDLGTAGRKIGIGEIEWR